MDSIPQTRPTDQNAMDRGVSLLDIAAKSALHSAIQQPMEGICQLVGVHAPKLFSDSGKYEFNTPEWYASTIGHGAGFMLPYWVTSKTTGLLTRETGVQKAMLDGALSGALFTPTGEGENPVTGRAMAAFNSSIMFGTQHYLAGELAPRFAIRGMPLATRLSINTATGTAAGLTAMEATSLVSGNGFITDGQTILENAVAAGATGFALDAMNATFARKAPATAEAPQRRFSFTATPEGLAAEQGNFPLHDTNAKVFSEGYRQTSEWTGRDKGILEGSKQYTSDSGKVFWQSPDGRIWHTEGTGESEQQNIWAPYGTGKPAAYVSTKDTGLGHRVWVRHEPQGLFFHENHQEDVGFFNSFRHDKPKYRPPLSPELRNELTLSVPQHVEPDALAASRILRTADGADYEPTTLTVRVPKPGVNIPDGLTMTDFVHNWTVDNVVPARRYQIMSADAVIRQRELTPEQLKEMSTSIVVPEDYAHNLDKVRELRRTAVLEPEMNPEQSESILAARRELFLSRFNDRLLPEHWGQFLDVVPNRQSIHDLQLLDTHDPEDPSGKTIADTELAIGRIRFFGDNNGIQQHVRRTLLHEWTHSIEESHPAIRQAFDWATKLESFNGRDYAGKNEHENWAVHLAEMLMDPSPELFLTFAHRAPIRTVLLGEALRREMYSSENHQSINVEELQTRLDYIDKEIMPLARRDVTAKILYKNHARTVSDAVEMIDNLAKSKSQADRDLAAKLVDTDAVFDAFDKQAKVPWKRFFTTDGANALQRFDLLLQMKPEQAQTRLEAATNVVALLKRGMHMMLTSDQPESAIDTTEQMFRTVGTAELIRRTVPFEDLAHIASTNSDPALSGRAFDILQKSFPLSRVNSVALSMVKDGAAGADVAAKFIINSRDIAVATEGLHALRDRAKAGDSAPFTQDTLDALYSKLDRDTVKIVEGRTRNVHDAILTLARARLLETLAFSQPSTFNPVHEARMRRTAQLEPAVNSLIEAKRNGEPADKAEVEFVMDKIAPGSLELQSRLSSAGLLLLP